MTRAGQESSEEPSVAGPPGPDPGGPAEKTPQSQKQEKPHPQELGPGLRKIRRRRWILWIVLLIYLPSMMAIQEATGSFEKTLPAFFAWVGLLVIATAVSATARCPRCGNYFHVNGMALLYLRRCLHCQLHLTADRRG